MSNIKSLFGYTTLRQSIQRELDERQEELEKLGFKVKRYEHMVHYEAALSLAAEKNDATLMVTNFLQGRKDVSVVIRHGRHEVTMPLYPYTFNEAVAVVENL